MSGMVITETKLIEIIKACGENGVESLEVGEIKLKFYNNNHHNQNEIISLPSIRTDLDQKEFEEAVKSDSENTSEVTEEMLIQLSIDDPVLYEELCLKQLNEGR